MEIRRATHFDIPRIVEMAEKFYPLTRYVHHFPMKKECAAGLAILMMGSGTMLVAEAAGDVVGMIGTYIDPFTFNDDHLIAKELVWWVEPDHHGSGLGRTLLREVEIASAQAGAEMIVMMDLADNPVSERVYAQEGYCHSENSWTKALV